jgi:hypothetical protein
VKLSVNAGAALDSRTQEIFAVIWLEGLGDLPFHSLEAAFSKTLRECAFWPVKVADIRKHVSHAEKNASNRLAEEAWREVLDIRRTYWSPDAPGGFWSGAPVMSEQLSTAARAAGVFREHESTASLHVWSKKRFLESFTAYGERESDVALLPGGEDGEMRKLIGLVSHRVALPPAPQSPPEERLRVADQLADAARQVLATRAPQDYVVSATDEQKSVLRFQAELIRAKYPDTEEAKKVREKNHVSIYAERVQ